MWKTPAPFQVSSNPPPLKPAPHAGSERLSGLVQLDDNANQPPAPKGAPKGGKGKPERAARSISAPKQRAPKELTPRAKGAARRSEPPRPTRQPLAQIEDPLQEEETWGGLPVDLLICIVRQLAPRSAACMRLVPPPSPPPLHLTRTQRRGEGKGLG